MRAFHLAAAPLTAGLLLVPATAFAQLTITPATANEHPDHVAPDGTSLGTSTHPSPFDPFGVSYADCAANLSLSFSLDLEGFLAGQQLAIWASPPQSTTIDCTQSGLRDGKTCWPVAAPITSVSAGVQTVSVRIWDLVGNEAGASASTTYTPQTSTACLAQAGQDAVPLAIWFMPLDGSGNFPSSGATVYVYDITTDLVGPAPPAQQALGVGDTFLTVQWSPNVDTDTIGYDVYMFPGPSSEAGASTEDAEAGPTIECPDGTAPGGQGCVTIGTGGGGGGVQSDAGMCSNVLEGFTSIFPTAAPPPTPADAAATTDEDAGDGGVVTNSSGQAGIGAVPASYLVASTAVPSVFGAGNGSFRVTGLTNGTYYESVVAAVDAEGNVGPPSGPQAECDFPGTTNDFFQVYRADGGQAGGCMLDPGSVSGGGAAAGVGIVLLARVARRRRKRGPDMNAGPPGS